MESSWVGLKVPTPLAYACCGLENCHKGCRLVLRMLLGCPFFFRHHRAITGFGAHYSGIHDTNKNGAPCSSGAPFLDEVILQAVEQTQLTDTHECCVGRFQLGLLEHQA